MLRKLYRVWCCVRAGERGSDRYILHAIATSVPLRTVWMPAGSQEPFQEQEDFYSTVHKNMPLLLPLNFMQAIKYLLALTWNTRRMFAQWTSDIVNVNV